MEDGEFSEDVAQDAGADTYSLAEEVLREPSELPEYDAPPQSWKQDVAERHWNNLAPDLRGYLHTRETEANGKISQQGQRLSELEGISSRYQSIDGVFQRYQQYIPEGLEREQAIASLLEAHRLLADPATRPQAMAQMFEAYGVSNPLDVLPQYREHFVTTQRELQSAKQADVQRTLDEFTKDKAYYPEIRDAVIQEILEIRKGAPGLDNATVLKLAHDRVVDRTGIKSRLDLEAKAKELEDAQKREADQAKVQRAEYSKRVTAARRAASVNVKSTPVRSAPKSMEEEMKAIWHQESRLMTFPKGQSGNPAGKKPGTRNKTTVALETLLDGEADRLTRKAIEMALKGDPTMMRLCIERVIPARRDRPINFELPPLVTTKDASVAMLKILEGVSKGELTPSEASEISKVIENYAETVRMTDLEQRILEMEQRG